MSILYTSDSHDITIRADIGARGQGALGALGFLSEYKRLAADKSTAARERLRIFLESRKAAQAAMMADDNEQPTTERV